MSIVCKNLTYRHGHSALALFSNLDFTICPGTINAILGPNGSGKTTLIKLMSGIRNPVQGTITIGTLGSPHQTDVRHTVATTFDKDGLYARLTGWENLFFFGRLYGLSKRHVKTQAEGWLSRWELSAVMKTPISTWSKGMRQKLALIRSLLADASVLIFDESWTGLSEDARGEFLSHLTTCAKQGKTILFSSHDLTEVVHFAQHLYVLHQGRLLFEGPTEKILSPRLLISFEPGCTLPDADDLKLPYPAYLENSQLIIPSISETEVADIIKYIVNTGYRIFTVQYEKGLESNLKRLLETEE